MEQMNNQLCSKHDVISISGCQNNQNSKTSNLPRKASKKSYKNLINLETPS